jgi:acyl-coenzyme A thioesterase PaaI-like protein
VDQGTGQPIVFVHGLMVGHEVWAPLLPKLGPGLRCIVPTWPLGAHTQAMAADERGLVHGGFVFGAADYAAMLAINDPNVVLGSADVRFVAPVRVGEIVVCEARRTGGEGRRHVVDVVCRVGERVVLRGTFATFVLDQHVLG